MIYIVIAIIIIALVFDFLNGANDRANAIATTTATKAMSPTQALIVASVFNGLGALFFTKVAETIGKGIVLPEYTTLYILLGGVVGASIWTFICTRLGVPISVTHALVGGIMGSGIAAGGFGIINWEILTPTGHLYYFSPMTLRNMLNATGFRIIKTSTHGNITQNERIRSFAGYRYINGFIVKTMKLGDVMTVYASKV